MDDGYDDYVTDDDFFPCLEVLDDGVRRCRLDGGHEGEHWSDGRVAHACVMMERETFNYDPTALDQQIRDAFERIGARLRGAGSMTVDVLAESDPATE